MNIESGTLTEARGHLPVGVADALPHGDVVLRRDALVVPYQKGMRDGKIWPSGVFDADGTPSPHAQMQSMTRRAEITPGLFEAARPNARQLTGKWLFCGLGSEQFGFMISRGLGRLWALDRLPPDTKLLFSAINMPRRKHAFLTKFLEALDLPHEYFILQRPALVEELYLAPELFGEHMEGRATPECAAWLRSRVPKQAPSKRKVYLTRSQLDPAIGRMLCEDILEANLRHAGFEIVAPEQLSVQAQLELYGEADVIVAAEGSALHVVPFAIRDDARLVVVQRRPDVPILIANQIESFTNASCVYLDALVASHWPAERADNLSMAELDFDKLQDAFVKMGLIRSKDMWRVPSQDEVLTSRALGRPKNTEFLTDAEREEFLTKLRDNNRRQRKMKDMSVEDPIPEIAGLRYFRLLSRMHEKLQPNWYLEVGTFTGKSLALARCNTVAVDPSFKIEHPVINPDGNQMFFFQQTSDDFFDSGFLKANKIKPDFAFLDGMHLFEYLLRDFMAAEKAMGKNGVICLHDCCPTTAHMAEREYHEGMWTGDVWKTLLILIKNRPDLRIDVTDAANTGLVVIRNLNPKSRVLDENYDDLINTYMDLTLDDLEGGIGGLDRQFDLMSPQDLVDSL
jgi:capsular polysaccharide biosynthesis protein